VGFVVDKVALVQDFFKYFGFPCQFSFHRLLHIHHLPCGAGSIAQLVAYVLLLLLLLLFILTANGFLPGGSGNTIRHNKQITHITQNNATIKRNTAHKTTHTIKDTLTG
jgi:hypothetical protein